MSDPITAGLLHAGGALASKVMAPKPSRPVAAPLAQQAEQQPSFTRRRNPYQAGNSAGDSNALSLLSVGKPGLLGA